MSIVRRAEVAASDGWSSYPEGHDSGGRIRFWPLSDAGGLSQFGVAYEVLQPGPGASLHHWHEQEDEFLYLLDGEVTVIEGEGPGETRTVLRPGDAAAWKAGDPVGHSLFNHTDRPCAYLIAGTSAETETAHYPGRDLVFRHDSTGTTFTHLDGTPYTKRRPADRKD